MGGITLGGRIYGPETINKVDLGLALAIRELKSLIIPVENWLDFAKAMTHYILSDCDSMQFKPCDNVLGATLLAFNNWSSPIEYTRSTASQLP